MHVYISFLIIIAGSVTFPEQPSHFKPHYNPPFLLKSKRFLKSKTAKMLYF